MPNHWELSLCLKSALQRGIGLIKECRSIRWSGGIGGWRSLVPIYRASSPPTGKPPHRGDRRAKSGKVRLRRGNRKEQGPKGLKSSGCYRRYTINIAYLTNIAKWNTVFWPQNRWYCSLKLPYKSCQEIVKYGKLATFPFWWESLIVPSWWEL